MPHMPGYVFNSHADSVVDMFWADNHHIVSGKGSRMIMMMMSRLSQSRSLYVGSKDCTVRMHALRDATIPIENLRTVNISFSFCKAYASPSSEGGSSDDRKGGGGGELVNTVADVTHQLMMSALGIMLGL